MSDIFKGVTRSSSPSVRELVESIDAMFAEALDLLEKIAARTKSASAEGDNPTSAFRKHLASLSQEARALEVAKLPIANPVERAAR